jgi:hypothetical protein
MIIPVYITDYIALENKVHHMWETPRWESGILWLQSLASSLHSRRRWHMGIVS